ncbi:flagellar basal body P-ring biosynthesis protein FlgA [Paenibacillus jamilae]|uniref:Flagellar basal body P-ring biosynthesis protein FlgA n=1 Tax=Paenibacillus jamilae TaxID=114136 RepID=A0ACC4ZSZ0_9BACL|nr:MULTISPECIES: SAF domain-containing protein [Paenibacillus]AUO08567.1 flagellar biosynthesis protein FlgA [Paenibacillus sp. lzh-N1]KTS81390.1 flagellar basal body P-ring biosynthesis protein FlgA [Paenibacillus jamilae]
MSKLRKSSKQKLSAGCIGAGIVGMIFVSYLILNTHQMSEIRKQAEVEAEQKWKLYEQEQRTAKTGWAVVRDISPGEQITSNDLKGIKVPGSQAPSNLLANKNEVSGTTAKIELKKGSVLTSAMITAKEPTPKDLRNRELKVVVLPSSLKSGDEVDIRIQFPTGQDYILLSKKKISRLEGPIVWVTMNEQEILSLSSAIVDAYLHKASIYALTYVDPQFQPKAIPTYPPNAQVLALMNSDPNLVRVAEQKLSKQLRDSLENAIGSSNNVISTPAERVLSEEVAAQHAGTAIEDAASGIDDTGSEEQDHKEQTKILTQGGSSDPYAK